MSAIRKALYGVAAFVPVVGTLLGFFVADSFALPVALVAVLVGFSVMVGFSMIAWRSGLVPDGKRANWVTFLIIGSLIAFPAFWLVYIWPTSGQRD